MELKHKDKTTAAEREAFRKLVTQYCITAENFRLNRGYSQYRPVQGYGRSPEAAQKDDCSGFDSKVFYWVGTKLGWIIRNPLTGTFDYLDGYGNTESMQEFLKHEAPVDKYLVGDIPLWGPNNWDTHHTAVCRKAGTRRTALFTSHGHQSWRFSRDAPESVRLVDFPQHLIGVYRHPALR